MIISKVMGAPLQEVWFQASSGYTTWAGTRTTSVCVSESKHTPLSHQSEGSLFMWRVKVLSSTPLVWGGLKWTSSTVFTGSCYFSVLSLSSRPLEWLFVESSRRGIIWLLFTNQTISRISSLYFKKVWLLKTIKLWLRSSSGNSDITDQEESGLETDTDRAVSINLVK